MAQRTYETKRIAVHWDSSRCIHTRRCIEALPGVFDPQRRPWIDVTRAEADALAAAVERCPTGALRHTRLDGAEGERPASPATATPTDDGPLMVRGDLRVVGPDGETLSEETRVTLCRCGNSRNQPYCDNSHVEGGFRSSDYAARPARDPAAPGGPVTITATRDGSLHVEGHLVVEDPQGERLGEGDDLWLCRCGRSAAKPFCDASHRGQFRSRPAEVHGGRRDAETPEAFEPNLQVPPA